MNTSYMKVNVVPLVKIETKENKNQNIIKGNNYED